MKLLWSISLLCFTLVAAEGRQLFVGDNHEFQAIQDAVNAAEAFDTVIVKKGEYNQYSIVIRKPLMIVGENQPVVNANYKEVDIFIVAADSVVIEGFVLTNVGVSHLKEYSAIRVKKGRYGSIRNNQIKGCFFGIYIEFGQHYMVEKNQILGEATGEASAGNAIHAWKGNNLKISNNVVTGHRDGIYLEFVDDSQITGNKSYHNLRYGLHFMFSNNDQYIGNEFRENGAGVAVMFSKNIRMKENKFIKNWGGASYGLLLKEISDGEISGNEFIENTKGILAEGANRLLITGNQFTSNGTALDIKGNCLDNQILKNNFLSNTFDVVTNSRHNNNEYHQNYWSTYSGYDLNHDGTGDVPFRPVNIFAMVTNKIPAATIMLHSLLVNLLELGERIFPEVIPPELIDQSPQMKPYNYD